MTRHLPHIERDCKPHLVNFRTHASWILPPPARTLALECCHHDHGRTMHLHIAVIMPDHVHLILTPLVDYDRLRVYPLAEILWAIKSASAHRINHLLHRSGAVWQPEYFDTAIRRSESLDSKIEYVRQNPVRAGLVGKAEDYEWCWESPRAMAPAAPEILSR